MNGGGGGGKEQSNLYHFHCPSLLISTTLWLISLCGWVSVSVSSLFLLRVHDSFLDFPGCFFLSHFSSHFHFCCQRTVFLFRLFFLLFCLSCVRQSLRLANPFLVVAPLFFSLLLLSVVVTHTTHTRTHADTPTRSSFKLFVPHIAFQNSCKSRYNLPRCKKLWQKTDHTTDRRLKKWEVWNHWKESVHLPSSGENEAVTILQGVVSLKVIDQIWNCPCSQDMLCTHTHAIVYMREVVPGTFQRVSRNLKQPNMVNQFVCSHSHAQTSVWRVWTSTELCSCQTRSV